MAKKILVIDDEDDIRALLLQHLTKKGYQAFEAHTGELGLELAQSEGVDLVLLDIMMPKMSGHQVWSFFKRDPKLRLIPILVISAMLQSHDTFWRSLMPAENYFTKPFSFEKLTDRIQKLVG
jgi:DNA-binding response OmpR family regulator